MQVSGLQAGDAAREMRPPLILALDIGTSSLRARLYDSHGSDLPALDVQSAYDLLTTPDGGAMLDARCLFAAVVDAIDALLSSAGSLVDEIAAVGLSTLAFNLLGLDQAGQPVTPVYTYADTRPEADAAALRRQLDEPAVFDRTGCPLRVSYAPALLRWLGRTQPDLAASVRLWLSFGDYLLFQFLGQTAISQSMAAWGGLLNRHTGAWDEELLAALSLSPQLLPSIAPKGQLLHGLRPEWAARWPALARVPWLPALGDGACSNAGSGCIGPARTSLSVGTSGALRLLVDGEVDAIPWGLWAYRIDERRTLVGGALNNGGSVFAWLQSFLAAGSFEELEAQVAALEPDSHGLTMLPFLAGERSPIWRADARAAVVGLHLNTQPAHLVRAGMEAVSYRFALLRRLLAELSPQEGIIVASGGAMMRSPVWVQMIADVLNCPIALSGEQEATSRGAALFALEALGRIERLDALPARIATTFEPDAQRHVIYRRGLERHLDLYNRLLGSE